MNKLRFDLRAIRSSKKLRLDHMSPPTIILESRRRREAAAMEKLYDDIIDALEIMESQETQVTLRAGTPLWCISKAVSELRDMRYYVNAFMQGEKRILEIRNL